MLSLSQLINSAKKFRGKLNASTNGRELTKKYNVKQKKLLFSIKFAGETEPGTHYPQIMFFDIDAVRKKDEQHPIPFKTTTGYIYLCKPPRNAKVQVRCNCSDYRFTWYAWNKEEDSHYGRDFPPYERKTDTRPERNPDHLPGMCKHLMGLIAVIRDKGFI